MKTLHINIFGSPSAGKSTLRAELFSTLKKLNYKVEEIHEYAKQLTYEENFSKLKDSTLMVAEQHHRHFILEGKVDITVTDSPFIMALVYNNDNTDLDNLAFGLHRKMNTLNFFLNRNHDYQSFGRNQNEEESNLKTIEIKKLLTDNNIIFEELYSCDDNVMTILRRL